MYETDKDLYDEVLENVVDSQPNENVDAVEEVEVKEQQQNVDIEDVEHDDFDQDESEEVVDPQPKSEQSHQENAQYKKMRLQAKEEIERELAEQRKELEAMRISLEQQKSERKILDEYLNPRKVWEYADQEGISEEHAKKMLQYEADKLINSEKLKVRESFEKQQSTKRKLAKDKYFKLLENDVDEIMKYNPEADYEAIYYYQRGVKAEELEEKYANNVEKRTVANMHDRARRKNIGSSDGGDDTTAPTSILSREGLELANAFGNDPREIARYVKNSIKKKG